MHISRQPPPTLGPVHVIIDNPDRRFQTWRAFIGLVAGLLGAVIGGGATLIATNLQQHSAAASQIESERESAYIAYNTAMDAFIRDALVHGRCTTLKQWLWLNPWFASLTSGDNQLIETADQVTLLGSPQMREIVSEQQDIAGRLYDDASALWNAQITLATMNPAKLAAVNKMPGIGSLNGTLIDDIIEFAHRKSRDQAAARAELDLAPKAWAWWLLSPGAGCARHYLLEVSAPPTVSHSSACALFMKGMET